MARKRDKQNLKTGFTTGAAAAAAAKAALLLALTGEKSERVRIGLLPEGSLEIPVKSSSALSSFAGECIVIKDAGDDPDVTHGAEIGVRVRILEQEDGGRWAVVGGQRSEDGGQRSEVRGQRAEGRGQRAEGRGRSTEDGGQRAEDAGMLACWHAGIKSGEGEAEGLG
ncbi:MAG: cobalt-precorrin-5B (C(1))-methyltransferase, partial [Thermodesulfobacteriota bacterium]